MYFPSYRIKRNGVPILSKIEIDNIAEAYLQDFCPKAMKTPMELDIDSFIQNYLGLKQDFQYLSHNGIYLGMTVFNDTNKLPVYDPITQQAEYISTKAGTIIIDNSLLALGQEHRYRYTMGHEGGHNIFHKHYFTCLSSQSIVFGRELGAMVQCRALPIASKTKPVSQWDDGDRMEWQANYMSSALLMPKTMVYHLIKSLLPNKDDEIRYKDYIYKIVRTFNVSKQAAEYRLKQLGIISNNNFTK
ncbi:MAG: ImmA/IrrE family metallo-endopeptidase [Epulopiscium sp.]|nr:ImmA/IrrE family metallo-endopeptidase [Candidatus Epulonipiscium sp.]